MPVAERITAFFDWYLHRIPGGRGRTAPRVAINLHKGTIGLVVLALMLRADDHGLAAWLYLVLHGSYGLLWVAKDVAFPDPAWRARASISSAVAVLAMPLGLYYLAPLVMFTALGPAIPGGWGTPATLPASVAAAAVACYAFGVFLHFGSDAQKYFVLAHERPRRLITDGFFAATRNPNYLGEILIYASFNLLAQHALPWAACALVWVGVFVPNMLRKERSMSRYPDHAAWVARTGFLLPRLGTLLASLPGAFRAGETALPRTAPEGRLPDVPPSPG
jgi:protein-S-isoprenylcysteine O-methyltransferase Ste14